MEQLDLLEPEGTGTRLTLTCRIGHPLTHDQRDRLVGQVGGNVNRYRAIIEESGGHTAPPPVPTA